MTDDKQIIRAEFLAKRQSLPIAEQLEASRKIAANFFKVFAIDPAKIIAGYYPIKNEVGGLEILRGLLRRGNICALPCVTDLNSPLVFRVWNETTPLKEKKFGISEPMTEPVIPDVVLTPLVAFDARGYRIGYGAGLYDRSFAQLPNVLKIGLAYEMQNCASVPHDVTDVKLDYVVTELRVYKS